MTTFVRGIPFVNNLMGANLVLFYDPDKNSQTDAQVRGKELDIWTKVGDYNLPLDHSWYYRWKYLSKAKF